MPVTGEVNARILGVGRYLPERVVTNAQLTELMDTSDEWIQQRTGIRERHFISADAGPADLFSAGDADHPRFAVVWRVGLDGKETRLRGGELAPVPIPALKEIVAAGTLPAVIGFSGRGAYSIASPALLFKELRVAKSTF